VEPIWYATAIQRGAFEVTKDNVLDDPTAGSRGTVVAYVFDQQTHASEHERITQAEFARRLAALKNYEAGGLYDPRRHYPGRVYFVPGITLTSSQAAALGIRGSDDLFGGGRPHAFVATKVISHPLIEPGAAALPGWNPAFEAQVGDAVLAGYAVFIHEDALRAGRRLLESGPVRIKQVLATGGHGSRWRVTRLNCKRQLEAIAPGEVLAHGLVLEENLSDVRTFSVGQVKVGDLMASYFGQQRLTLNNRGAEVYGGSDLTVVRGDFDALLAQDVPSEVRSAVGHARRFNAAVIACYPGFFASRNNYDIILGRDAAGRSLSGVLEQSWRLGGAQGAEIAALEIFRWRPDRNRVRASAVEVFGESPPPPPHATVYFRGDDPRAGRLTKYSVVHSDAHP
jgi:hypothetical protein